MKRNSTVAAWTCLMLLLMASPAAAQSRTALDAATDKSREQAAVRVVTSSQAVQPNQQSTETDKQLEQVQAQMKELRAEMKQLREKNFNCSLRNTEFRQKARPTSKFTRNYARN